MVDELTICAATYFRIIGKDVSTPDEFVMSTSLEMKWMPPSESKKLLKKLLSSGLFVQKGEFIRPGSDFSGLDLPMAYKPSPEIVEMEHIGTASPAPAKTVKKSDLPPDMFHILISIAKENGMDKGFVPKCAKIQKKLNIDISVAGLLVLRDGGVDVKEQYKAVYDSIISSR